MNKSIFKSLLFFIAATLLFSLNGTAQIKADPIEGNWYNAEKTAKIKIYRAVNGKFYGKIYWLKEPNKNGVPKTDENNPSSKLKTKPLLGLTILSGFVKDGTTTYEDGKIYDPKNGKTYSCIITHKGNSLDIRGYVGISLIGRTTNWQKAD